MDRLRRRRDPHVGLAAELPRLAPSVSDLLAGDARVVLIVASHLGASITHGRDFLTRFAPGPLRALLGGTGGATVAPGMKSDLMQQPVFSELIPPILQRRCLACHGPEKHKADPCMESYETLLKFGKDGPVLIAGKALESPMI